MLHVASDTERQRNHIEISPHQFDEKQKDYNRLIHHQHLNKCKKLFQHPPTRGRSYLLLVWPVNSIPKKEQHCLETENNSQISCFNADVFPTQPLHGRHPV